MALLDYISIEISEVLSDCGYMNDRVFGKYMRLLFYWYRDGCKPLSESQLKSMTNPRGNDMEQIKLRLYETPEGWVQKRLFKSYQNVLEKSEKARASATARWEQDKRNADAMRSQLKSDADAMLIVNSKDNTLPLTGKRVVSDEKDGELKLPDPVEVAFKQFQEFAKKHDLPKPTKLTKKRRAALRARFIDHGGPQIWAQVLQEIEVSPGLRGDNSRGWQVDFDFLLQPSSLQKLLEGKYRKWGMKHDGKRPEDDDFKRAAVGAIKRSRE